MNIFKVKVKKALLKALQPKGGKSMSKVLELQLRPGHVGYSTLGVHAQVRFEGDEERYVSFEAEVNPKQFAAVVLACHDEVRTRPNLNGGRKLYGAVDVTADGVRLPMGGEVVDFSDVLERALEAGDKGYGFKPVKEPWNEEAALAEAAAAEAAWEAENS